MDFYISLFESNDDNIVFKYRFLLIYFLKNLNNTVCLSTFYSSKIIPP